MSSRPTPTDPAERETKEEWRDRDDARRRHADLGSSTQAAVPGTAFRNPSCGARRASPTAIVDLRSTSIKIPAMTGRTQEHNSVSWIAKLTATSLLPACLLIVFSPAMIAQQNSPSPAISKFTVRTELVTVPVVVLRRASPWRQVLIHGQLDEHVTGLTKDDFEIKEDGQRKPIATFEEVTGSKSSVKVVTPPSGMYTNEVMADGPVPLVVILLDLINTPFRFQESTKRNLLEYLQTEYRADRPTMLAVLHPDGLRILHDFTSDPEVLRAIVRRLGHNLEHDPALDNQVQTQTGGDLYKPIDVQHEYDQLQSEFFGDDTGSEAGRKAYEQHLKLNRLESAVDELQQLAHALSAVRGMKSLVWATGGVTLPSSLRSGDRQLVEKYIQTVKLLSAAGIAVYPIDTVLETENPVYKSPQSRYPGSSTIPLVANEQKVQNFMDISRRTGGDYCLLRKDADLCFRKAMDYGSQYYLLTYYAEPAESARWRKISVKARGGDLEARARSGYFSSGANGNPDQRRKRDIAQAFDTPIEYRGLTISVRWMIPAEGPARKATAIAAPPGVPQLQLRRPNQPFVLRVDPAALTVDTADNNHIKLDIVAVAFDRTGKVVGDMTQQLDLHPSAKELEQLRTKGFAYSNAINVPSSAVKVRFIVRDDLSERLGTVSAPPAK